MPHWLEDAKKLENERLSRHQNFLDARQKWAAENGVYAGIFHPDKGLVRLMAEILTRNRDNIKFINNNYYIVKDEFMKIEKDEFKRPIYKYLNERVNLKSGNIGEEIDKNLYEGFLDELANEVLCKKKLFNQVVKLLSNKRIKYYKEGNNKYSRQIDSIEVAQLNSINEEQINYLIDLMRCCRDSLFALDQYMSSIIRSWNGKGSWQTTDTLDKCFGRHRVIDNRLLK